MSDERQETIADIVAEMRKRAEEVYAGQAGYPESWQDQMNDDEIREIADRIEAAAKREREAGAEAAQICGEIGEMVGREATTEKFSAVGKVAQEMLNTSMQAVTAERINGWASRLAEACEQPVTDCNQLGNAAAMREALEQIHELLSIGGNPDTAMCIRYEAAYQIAAEALSSPSRNCDIGTAEEQDARHSKWCRRYGIDGDMEVACAHKDMSCALCALRWAQMPYEKGGAK